MRLLSYNIRYGGVGREAALARVIAAAEPDLVLLQEATRPEAVARIGRLAGMKEWRSQSRRSLAFLSREPVAHAAWHRPRLSQHAFLEIVPGGTQLRVFGLHLSAIHSAWTERRRLFELRALLRTIVEHQRGFHVLAGDFNTLAPGARLDVKRLPPRLRPFVWMSGGRIKWRTIQSLLAAGYADAYRLHHAMAPGHSFPTWDPHIRLDYLFVPKPFADRIASCDIVAHPDAAVASDHFPLVAELTLGGGTGSSGSGQ